MANLTTQYAGLTLKNPLIVSSSGLTNSLQGIKKAYEAGAGAVVIKSLFEEQIIKDSFKEIPQHAEEYDYLMKYNTHSYLQLIEDAKKACKIPIIASINCTTSAHWSDYAKSIESSGADALELNIMIFPEQELSPVTTFEKWFYENYPFKTNVSKSKIQSSEEIERNIYQIVKNVKLKLKIPVTAKLGPYFTSLETVTEKLSTLCNGIVLFNNFYTPDFDINTGKLIHNIHFSHPEQMYNTLRWITLISKELKCDLSASTGIHNYESCIKMIMAGASSVQLCSVLYQKGLNVIPEFLSAMEKWMKEKGYKSINDFKGSIHKNLDKNIFSRMQYIKMYSGLDQ
ncbi:MAG: hypothetical protein A2202_05095 [Bdellovibrionales bacterium RIFOXYA1_FULL_36_14]|nr:MAG: hypothetical protein A2202_05095 [Bdellovibrionales bacterium RIFOXYA1_FULL_36_14]